MDIAGILSAAKEIIGVASTVSVEGPKIIKGVKDIWAVATSETPATVEQQNEFDAALEEAHNALQNS